VTSKAPVAVHASCVALNGKAILIQGPSGSGKSGLALQLMALGATLVADDQTLLDRVNDTLIASCPPSLTGLIEARGIGILRAPTIAKAEVCLVVDLGETTAVRLPDERHRDILGVPIDLVSRVEADHFASALLCLLSNGRHVG
jgi:HPr kinase/phosphorylase